MAPQRDFEGKSVTAKSWWEGQFHKTRLQGGPRGVVESWRSIDAGLMVVKTSLKLKDGREVSMISYLEDMSVPGGWRNNHVPGGFTMATDELVGRCCEKGQASCLVVSKEHNAILSDLAAQIISQRSKS